MVLHLEHRVQPIENVARLAEIGSRQRELAKHVQDGDREHRGADAVSRHVDEIDREAIVIERAVAERVAADFRGRHDEPFGLDRAVDDRRGQEREHVIARLLEVAVELLGFLDLARAPALVLEHLLADFQNAAVGQQRRILDALAVDIGAVGRAQVGDEHLAGDKLEPAVPPRHVGARQRHLAGGVAADGDRLGVETHPASEAGAADDDQVVAEFLLAALGKRILATIDRRAVAVVFGLRHERVRPEMEIARLN